MRKFIAGLAGQALFLSRCLAQAPEVKLPAGEGKQVTERVCSACHGIETAVGERHDKAGWQKVIDDMVAKGADATDEEFKTIFNYLVKYFGPESGGKR